MSGFADPPRSPVGRRPWALGLMLATGLLAAGGAQASENGASLYLLGTGGPGAAEMPPIQGVFLANTLYHYDASMGADEQLPLGGNLVVGLDAKITADFATALWVPSTNVAGGTLGLGLALPAGKVDAAVSDILTGPLGNRFTLAASESKFILGDPVLVGMLGWRSGRTAAQASAQVNVPIGDYRAGHLANLAFHRWILDTSLAVTWADMASGWDLSGKAGVTFNGENTSTDYTTGTESHYEASIAKTFSPAWSAGLQAYYFYQLSGDSGSGAVLGDFKGRVAGIGAQAAYNFKIADKIPATLRLHAFNEFNAVNRPEGVSVFLDFSMPLWVKLPPGAAAP